MEKSMREFWKALVICRKNCPWQKEQTIEDYIRMLEGETKEFVSAFEKKDFENMKEEFGDVFWDLLGIGVIAEEQKLFTVKEALEESLEKIKRRKPWIFGNEKVKNREEAVKRWGEIKELEKKGFFKKPERKRK